MASNSFTVWYIGHQLCAILLRGHWGGYFEPAPSPSLSPSILATVIQIGNTHTAPATSVFELLNETPIVSITTAAGMFYENRKQAAPWLDLSSCPRGSYRNQCSPAVLLIEYIP